MAQKGMYEGYASALDPNREKRTATNINIYELFGFER